MSSHTIRLAASMLVPLALALACGGGGSSPAERACGAVDRRAFDLCDQGNAGEVSDITDAINFCGIIASENEVANASRGDLRAACLDQGAAEGISGQDASEFVSALNGATSCADLADTLEFFCSM